MASRLEREHQGPFAAYLPKGTNLSGHSRERLDDVVSIEQVSAHDSGGWFSPTFTLSILTPLDDNRSAYQTMISTGAIADMRVIGSLRKIEDYYAAVDREKHFEATLEQNRDKLIDAELKVGNSLVHR